MTRLENGSFPQHIATRHHGHQNVTRNRLMEVTLLVVTNKVATTTQLTVICTALTDSCHVILTELSTPVILAQELSVLSHLAAARQASPNIPITVTSPRASEVASGNVSTKILTSHTQQNHEPRNGIRSHICLLLKNKIKNRQRLKVESEEMTEKWTISRMKLKELRRFMKTNIIPCQRNKFLDGAFTNLRTTFAWPNVTLVTTFLDLTSQSAESQPTLGSFLQPHGVMLLLHMRNTVSVQL